MWTQIWASAYTVTVQKEYLTFSFFFFFQIAHLNLTVNDLQKRVESPESANKITGDIQLLKKGMADTGGDITEVKDKIRQLTDLAGKQNVQVNTLKNKFFNLSVRRTCHHFFYGLVWIETMSWFCSSFPNGTEDYFGFETISGLFWLRKLWPLFCLIICFY